MVRATALTALLRAGGLTAADLATGVGDAAPAVRRRAAEMAVRMPAGDRVSLLPLLDDEDATVVEVAAWASGELSPPEPGAVARLSQLARDHDDALVREAAVAALGAIGDDAALPAVLAAMDDKATVRRRAVIALLAFEGPDVEAAIARARDDRDWQVRQVAQDLA
jgi:HEAT repeat protein